MGIAARMARELSGPVLDAPCGTGRNGKLLAALGFAVVCLDYAGDALEAIHDTSYRLWLPPAYSGLPWASRAGSLMSVRGDLLASGLPFRGQAFAGIINVHFTVPELLGEFERILMPGGFLFLETVGAQGGNYHQLPAPGTLKKLIPSTLKLKEYRERRVGPPGVDAVTVKLLAFKGSNMTGRLAQA
jgi:SAM-dependent methyltransferase